MGQRTAILIKRTFADNSADIKLIHHQWGYGLFMHQHFMTEFLTAISDRSYRLRTPRTLKDCFLFEEVSKVEFFYKNENYEKSDDAPNVFEKKIIKKYFEITDNNNGGLIIDVKVVPGAKYCNDFEHCNIAFITGPEECKNDQDEPFSELMTGAEYIKRTDPQLHPSFVEMWNKFVEFYEIKEVKD